MAQYVEQKQQTLAPVLKEKVELFICCRDLIKKDTRSKSDPFVVLYLKDTKTKQWVEMGRTEVIYDNHFPKFSTQFVFDYYFEQEQILRFDVFDEDKKGSVKLKDHDILGSCTMILGEVVHEPGCIMAKKLMHKGRSLRNKSTKRYSSLIATLEKVNMGNNQLITMQFSANNLPKMDGLFGKSDPYFLIQRAREDGKWITVYGNRDRFIKKTLNPQWNAFQIESQTLCNNDEFRPIVVLIYDWDSDGSDDFIGKIDTSLSELKTKPQNVVIVNDSAKAKKKKKKKKKSLGTFNVLRCEAEIRSSFFDYMQGNVDISLMNAIDFTGSNGHPGDYQSLHHIYGQNPSQYQRAIREIGNIVSVYDSDNKFPVWGFGAHFNNINVGGQLWNGVRHDFHLNFNLADPEVVGVHGVEQCYLNAIKSNVFALSGPTLFSPILKKAHAISQIAHDAFLHLERKNVIGAIGYFILLIITDGIINDMKQTKDEIVAIANEHLPLSVIIVGVGNADFSKMDELDGDDGALMNSKGEVAKRDIVQFVPMNKFEKLSELSKETLVEIPDQFLSYVRAWNIAPRPKAHVNFDQSAQNQNFVMSADELKQPTENFEYPRLPTIAPQSIDGNWDSAPLPANWERSYDENGNMYYVDNDSGTTQWEHPDKPTN